MTTAHEPGRTAYEARFSGEKQGPRGTVDPWEMLPEQARVVWRRVEEACLSPVDNSENVPICPFCGSKRHDSEWLHDGNRMETSDLVDAMITVFLREPDKRETEIQPGPFPASYPRANLPKLRAKMHAALGTAIRNMPYLAAPTTLLEGGVDAA
ncbi:hypothetical protein [Methylobacterium brachythecii]|nr:hypothetical protein [Methylobacterium brachythecii]MBB3905067.1 hypothetical protein [Methylobacterium brachythecii]